MFMRPLIGLTMNLERQATRTLSSVDLDYGKAVLQAGGVPVPLMGIEETIPDLVRKLDGFLFTGGDDIHPGFYHEKPQKGTGLHREEDSRVRFEMKLFRAAAKARKPVLAVCYGAQLANVALGGTLFQDIKRQLPRAIKHKASKKGEKVFHTVDIFEGTKLSGILGNCGTGSCSIRVRSSHHQSIKNPGRGLRLAAVAPDGVYEALESRGQGFLLTIQWHPEKTLADQATRKIFAALVGACRK
jgi:putative glutamine amidotransferase